MEHRSSTPPRAMSWATWRATLLLAAGVFVLRVIYLLWLCPFELAGDEAHYWEWSRRPSLSYYTKGPGVAWAIAAGTAVLGDTEAGVRLPAAVAALLATLGMARLTAEVSGGDERVGFVAAAAFNLVAGYQATAVLMTIDGPYVACWVLAAWAAWRIVRRWDDAGPGLWRWGGLGLALGVGFLFKYTILLLVPGLILYALLARGRLAWRPRPLLGLAVGLGVFALAASPVVIWNAQRGWPTVRHLLGHLEVRGGDVAARPAHRFNPMWVLEYLGSQVGLVGPLAMGLMIAAAVWAWRRRGSAAVGETGGAALWPAHLLMLCLAAPILLFYLLVSLLHEVEGNWPLAGYTTLLVLTAQLVVASLDTLRLGSRSENAPRPAVLSPPRRPLRVKAAWHWMIGYGLVAAVALHFMNLWPRVPGLGPAFARVLPLYRITGHRAAAAEVAATVEGARREVEALPHDSGTVPGSAAAVGDPFIIADRYDAASLLAFYLPGHPVVRSAAHTFGDRPSPYDDFADTRLDDPALTGRTAVLVGGGRDRWSRAFAFGEVRLLRPPSRGARGLASKGVFVGYDYRGARGRDARDGAVFTNPSERTP